MENRATKTMTQGDGLLLGKPAVPAALASPNSGQPVNNSSFADAPCETSSAQTSATPFSPATDEESHKVLYEAVSANVMSANFDVVHGDDYEYLPSSNPPAASPPAQRPPVDILTRAHNTQAQYATFSFVGGNRYRNANNQTRGPPK